MQSNRLSLVVALFLGAAIGAGVVSCTKAPAAQAAKDAAQQQWEYKLLASTDAKDDPDKLAKVFNELAADGWEYNGSISWYTAIFRRPKK